MEKDPRCICPTVYGVGSNRSCPLHGLRSIGIVQGGVIAAKRSLLGVVDSATPEIRARIESIVSDLREIETEVLKGLGG